MPATRTHSQSKRGLKITNIGPSKSSFALMIRVDWTDAKIVTVTTKQRIELPCKTVNTHSRVVVADAPTPVPSGVTIHLVASDSLPGWYYISRVTGEYVGCSCPSHQNRRVCAHQAPVLVAHNARQERNRKRAAVEFVAAVENLTPECPQIVPDEDQEFNEAVASEWASQARAEMVQVPVV